MYNKILFFIFNLLWLCSITAQSKTPKVQELHQAAVRAYQMGQDLSAAEFSRQVLIQQPNHCASGSLIVSAAIRSEFCRPDLIRMTQQLMGNGCTNFQSHADLILTLLYNDRAKEAGFSLEQVHRKFPGHPDLNILEAELAIGLRRFDPFIEGLAKLTGTQPSPEKVAFAIKKLDRVTNYFLQADSSKAEETLNRLLIRHTAKTEGKVLYAIWAWYRKQDPTSLALYFATYPEELNTYHKQYLPWLFIQAQMNTQPKQMVSYLKKWQPTNANSPYHLIHAFLQRKHHVLSIGAKNQLPWNAPKLVSFLEPQKSFPTLPYPPWFWDWTDTLTLAQTLFATIPGKQTDASTIDLLTAYEFSMRQDSLTKKQLLSLLMKQCEAHPIITQKVYKQRQAKQDSVILFAKLYESIRGLVRNPTPTNKMKWIQFRFSLKTDSMQNNLMLRQLLESGQIWAASAFIRITAASDTKRQEWSRIQELLNLITRTHWGTTQGYLPGLTEAGLIQSTRKRMADTFWTQPLDKLTTLYGFPSLVPEQ